MVKKSDFRDRGRSPERALTDTIPFMLAHTNKQSRTQHYCRVVWVEERPPIYIILFLGSLKCKQIF